ncbi:adenylate/guanylate cyclase domain-containing protein [Allonocardiopsis opalescens]|uniref:Adenylate cyclase n=1 Tax=Allonocardiopsis opalescens TaxID=1144618 RepID=A0A2T0QBW0_9ACTN|nr:adenylate/guanylate cyclase domain-containing protein [Allonocardiopsis opalescens]PRY01436.1 adenylate cyclase [Allonocardiopsis opalescens]
MTERPDSERIEEILLGGRPRYTRREVAELAGVSPDIAARLWQALGFATLPDELGAFTDRDVENLRNVGGLIERGVLDDDAAVRLARALGQTMARLAEWQVDILTTVLLDRDAPADDENIGELMALTEHLLPEMEVFLRYAWRRQLAASAKRMLLLADRNTDVAVNRMPIVVGFADLVSFTSLSRELDEYAFAEMIESFEVTAADIVAGCGGRMVKTLGDEVLFVSNTPAEGAEIALRLAERIQTHTELPDVRVGLALGPVLPLMGDVYGITVNRASRLTTFARPGTVLTDDAMARKLAGSRNFVAVRILPRRAHGIGTIQPYVLRRRV